MSSTAFPLISPSESPRVFGAPTLHTDGDLMAIGISADGILWSVEEPGELRGWSLASRRLVSSRPLDELATVWTFNWAARLLASASDEVNVWEIASGDQLATWSTPAWITTLAFQPGESILATGHDDGTIRIWDWQEQKMLAEMTGHRLPVSAVAFSWDGRHLATAGEDKRINLWDLQTGQKVGTLEGHKDRISGLVWHPDGRRLYSAAWDTTVRIWDVKTREPIILLNYHATQVQALALSGDGKLLASSDSANAVHLWDTELQQTTAVLLDSKAEVRWLAFAPNDERGNPGPAVLAYGGADRIIHLWDSRQGSGGTGAVDPLVSRTAVAVGTDGKVLFSLGAGTTLRVWDIETAQPVLSLEESPAVRHFTLSPDGKWIAASHQETSDSDRATLALYNAGTGHRQVVCDGQSPPITALAFDSTSALLAVGGVRQSDVWLWRVPSGQPALILTDAVAHCSVESLAFQPGGRLLAVAGIDWLATSGRDGQVNLWNLDSKKLQHTLPAGATAIAWHPDGKRLAVAGLNRVVRLWDAETDQVVREFRGHQETVTALAFTSDGKRLATGSDDRTLRVWDVETGEPIGGWELDNAIKAVAFSRDGRFVFTGNGNTSCYQLELERLLEISQ